MKQSKDNKFIPMTSVSSGKGKEIAADVYYYTNQIVNLVFIGKPQSKNWFLVDAGMPKSGAEIIEVAEERFGKNNPPKGILLTHGHFDHVGSIVHLLKHWQVPVYAHPLELPYLTGAQSYPQPDHTVTGGLLAKIADFYPNEPIDITEAITTLPENGVVPGLPDWQWVATPGHSPGQVAFYRANDGVLIAGDAFVTVKQDSLYKVLLQKEEVNGPPVYLTTNWEAAFESVKKLQQLLPKIAITGHGQAMHGDELQQGLLNLVHNFSTIAVPSHGKFVQENDHHLNQQTNEKDRYSS